MYLLADDVDPGGGAVAEVGPLGVPVALGPHTRVRGHPCGGGERERQRAREELNEKDNGDGKRRKKDKERK